MTGSNGKGGNGSGIGCGWVERRLAMDAAAGGGLGGLVARRHVSRCARCRGFRERLAVLDAALRVAAVAPPLPEDLRVRVAGAYHQEVGSRLPDELGSGGRFGWFGRSAWAVGGLAIVTLFGSILWSRLPDFGDPPRTVRIEIPSGYALVGQPLVTIRRASGVEEVQ